MKHGGSFHNYVKFTRGYNKLPEAIPMKMAFFRTKKMVGPTWEVIFHVGKTWDVKPKNMRRQGEVFG
jgi:hypothetical protein